MKNASASACTHAAGPYNYQNVDIEGTAVYTNNPPAGAFRGFGVTQSAHVIECLVNDLAEQLGLSGNLMGAANSSGGVMGKMIDAQSIVVASTATRWFDHEGDILRYVFFHSIALACLAGLLVSLQAYVWPFTSMVIR